MENTEALNKDIGQFLDTDEAKKTIAKVEEIVAGDPEMKALVAKAESPEDMYGVFKKFISSTLEDFKKIFHAMMDYFKAEKIELPDETMDAVVGGWSFSSFWNKYKETIITATVAIALAGVMATGLGAAAGVLIAASYGASVGGIAAAGVAGGVIGAVLGVGGMTAMVVTTQYEREFGS